MALDVSKKEWQSSPKIFGHGDLSSWDAGDCQMNHDQQPPFALTNKGESCRVRYSPMGVLAGARDNPTTKSGARDNELLGDFNLTWIRLEE